jgi:hypothetical protein
MQVEAYSRAHKPGYQGSPPEALQAKAQALTQAITRAQPFVRLSDFVTSGIVQEVFQRPAAATAQEEAASLRASDFFEALGPALCTHSPLARIEVTAKAGTDALGLQPSATWHLYTYQGQRLHLARPGPVQEAAEPALP